MGLDMYLEGRVRSYKSHREGETNPVRSALEAAAIAAGLPASDNIDFIELKREVAYWRKANQIHAWFVKNVQEGEDDCGHYYVGREQLTELRDTCQRVIAASPLVDGQVVTGYDYELAEDGTAKRKPNFAEGKVIADSKLAEELLPCASGFFFGGTEYDQWYLADLERTVEQIDRALAMPKHVEFYYHSSW